MGVRAIQRRLIGWVDAGVTEPLALARLRAQHTVVALIVLTGIPYSAMFLLNGMWVVAVLAGLAILLSPVGLALSRRGRIAPGGSVVSLSLLGAILAAFATRGAMESNSAVWLLLCPVLAFMMVGPHFGVVVGVLVATALGVFWGLQTAGVYFPSAIPPDVAWVLVGVDHVVVTMSIALLMWAQAGVWRRMLAVRKAAEEEAQAAAQARYTFLATMSHEIRTPLNGVLGVTEILMDSGLSESHRQLVGTVQGSGRLLRALLDDVLDFSRIDAGRLDLESAPLSGRRLCEDLHRLWMASAAEKGLALRLEWHPETPVWWCGDDNRLRQILGNLLSNAIKFTPEGSVCLSVRREDALLVLEVADTGIGIRPEAMETIFEPFSQADSSTSRRFGGTGLGLAISRRLVEAMDGQLGVRSAEGEGTVFTVRLPLRVASPPPSAQQQTAALGMAGRRVLVAEDNPVNQLVIRHFLGRLGLRVTMAEDGHEVIERWQAEAPELILMDCQMPGMDGLEATRCLREHGAMIPIIAVTASNMPGDRERCLAAGMSDFMDKPVQPEVLAEKLHRWLALAG